MKHLFSSHYLKKGFTLLELLITMVIFFMMITVVTSIFIYIYKTKGGLEARQTVTKESYFFLEKLQVMSKDYTIDYEEYRNRQQVGCISPHDAQRNTTGHCTMMTYYGNRNTPYSPMESNLLYFCTSLPLSFSPNEIVGLGIGWQDCLFDNVSSVVQQLSLGPILATSGFIQSYGQYAALFWDVLEDVDYIEGAVKDDDDIDLGDGPAAVYQTGTIYPQELYLISHDKQKRLFFRRKLIEQSDYNNDGSIGDSEKLYTIQVLQLRGFDAGEHHDFDAVNYSGVYNGVIDTWARDYSLGFICNGESVSGAYPDFRLPLDVDDGWQNLLTTDITISDWNIIVSPVIDPYRAWKQGDAQINPFFSIGFTAKLYGKNRSLKIPWDQMDIYSLQLQTTLSSVFR